MWVIFNVFVVVNLYIRGWLISMVLVFSVMSFIILVFLCILLLVSIIILLLIVWWIIGSIFIGEGMLFKVWLLWFDIIIFVMLSFVVFWVFSGLRIFFNIMGKDVCCWIKVILFYVGVCVISFWNIKFLFFLGCIKGGGVFILIVWIFGGSENLVFCLWFCKLLIGVLMVIINVENWKCFVFCMSFRVCEWVGWI